MADSRANIDLVFRNGLRDFEVLPPPEVWENIRPAVKKKTYTLPLLKAAASVAIVASMSFLAYRWGMDTSIKQFPAIIALDQESESTFVNRPETFVASVPLIKYTKSAVQQIQESDKAVAGIPDNVTSSVPNNSGIDVSNRLVAVNQTLPGLQDQLTKKYAKVNSPALEAVSYRYIQDNIEMPVMERWSISAMASPTYYSQFSTSGNSIAQQVAASDQQRVSYTGGLGLSYQISSRFSIQSGLYYSSIGQELNGVNAYSGFQNYVDSKSDHNFEIMTANGTVYASNPDIFLSSYQMPGRILTYYTAEVFDPVKANLSYVSSTIYQDMSFLELPVIVRYKVIDRKVGLNLVGGMSYNFLVNNSVYAVLDGGKYPVGTTEGLNAVSLSSSLGMGMEYKLSQNLSLNLEPTFRYYLNPFNSGKPDGIHPYSIGIFSGVAYKF